MRVLSCAIIVLTLVSHLLAEEANNEMVDARMKAMRLLASRMEVTQEVDGKLASLPLLNDPLTHYSDPSRRFEDGTLWGFGKANQRPQVLVTCYTKNATEGRWIHAVTSLSEHPLTLNNAGRIVWRPARSELTFATLPKAGEPVKSGRLRLAQMRKLARRFKAHHYWDPDNQRFELDVPIPDVTARYVKVSFDGQAPGWYNLDEITVTAIEASRLMLLGGETLNGPRYIWWNFVASSKEKIEAAKEAWREGDWQNGRFHLPPDDDQEFIPAPDR